LLSYGAPYSSTFLGVIFRVPLDSDLSQALNYSIGVRLEVVF
jgi:hypothetical protein